MPAINRESFIWNALGTKPAPGDEIYTPGEQPIASYDNWWNWAVSTDIEALDTALGAHRDRHEVGGPDELNIGGLPIDYVASLTGDSTTGEVSLIDESDNSEVARIDVDADMVYTWPAFGQPVKLNQGGRLGANLTRQDTGAVLFDYTTGKFSYAADADHATNADYATEAGDAETLDGYDSTAFLREGSAIVNTTGAWSYAQPVDADITGNAATATHAGTADTAGFADEAGNSDTVDGYHAQQLIDAAAASGEWVPITQATDAVTGDYFDWNHTSATTYDRYRLTIYHESHRDSIRKNFFWLNIGDNGVWDERDLRYNWVERDIENDGWTHHNSHGWTVGSCMSQTRTVSTYIISCPPSVNRVDNHWPVIGAVSDEVTRETPRTFAHGHLKTEYDTIDSFQLESSTDMSTGKIVLEGQNLGW